MDGPLRVILEECVPGSSEATTAYYVRSHSFVLNKKQTEFGFELCVNLFRFFINTILNFGQE